MAATAELLETVVFSWLIGNGVPGKNLSIYDPEGVWQPTPAYDLLCTQPYAVDELVGAAYDWPDRCGQIGFDDRQTALLADMLRTRIGSLKQGWVVSVESVLPVCRNTIHIE